MSIFLLIVGLALIYLSVGLIPTLGVACIVVGVFWDMTSIENRLLLVLRRLQCL